MFQMNLRSSVPPDPVFGTLQPLKTIPPTQLPTYKQIGKAIGYELRVLGVNRELRKGDHIYSNSAAYKKVTRDVIKIHQLVSICHTQEDQIENRIKHVWSVMRKEKMVSHKKKGIGKGRGRKKGQGRKKMQIEDVFDNLFDVIDDSKTDDSEMEFVRDQRTGRNLWIGGKTETCDCKDETTEEDANENCEGLMVTESETDEDDKTDDDNDIVRYEEKMKKNAEKDAIEERRREKKS